MSNEEMKASVGYADSPVTDKINTQYNSLKLSEMKVGTKIEGTLKNVDPAGSEYGATLTLTLGDGTDVKVFPCGNIKKFFAPEVVSGERPTGTFVRFTRKADKKINGKVRTFVTSDFAVFQEGYTPPRFREDDKAAAATAETTATTEKETTSIEDVKAALK